MEPERSELLAHFLACYPEPSRRFRLVSLRQFNCLAVKFRLEISDQFREHVLLFATGGSCQQRRDILRMRLACERLPVRPLLENLRDMMRRNAERPGEKKRFPN